MTFTVNLTSFGPLVSDILMKEPFSLDLDFQDELRAYRQRFSELQRTSDEKFDKWLAETNSHLLDDISNFIDEVFNTKNGNLFPESDAELIHPAQVILGMHTSDHPPTLNMIEQHVQKRSPSINVKRLQPKRLTKANLLPQLDELSSSPNILVIFEQTETFDRVLINTTMLKLHQLLSEVPSRRIMVFFCVSGNWIQISKILPVSISNRMKRMVTIVKDPTEILLELPARLFNDIDFLPMMTPSIVGTILSLHRETDNSVTNLRFIYQLLLMDYCHRSVSLLTLREDKLVEIFKTHPHVRELVSSSKSIIGDRNFKNININSPKELARYCSRCISNCLLYHRSLKDQIKVYSILLCDQSADYFPEDQHDIYRELELYRDLGDSSQFIDAIGRIKNYPPDRLKKRIEVCLTDYESRLDKVPDQHVRSILLKYLRKQENNDNTKELVSELIQSLIKHSQTLVNPLKLPLSEAVYYTSGTYARHLIQPSYRYTCMDLFSDEVEYFGILFNLIQNNTSEIYINDLFQDFLVALDKPNGVEIENRETAVVKTNDKSKRVKRKSTRILASKDVEAVDQKNQTFAESRRLKNQNDGVMKAVFIDLIECMERHNLIKRDSSKKSRGIINRCIWFDSKN